MLPHMDFEHLGTAGKTKFEPHAVPVRRAGLCSHELDEEAILYDPAQHAVHYLNSTAYLIWRACDGSTTLGELLAELTGSFAYDGPAEALNQQLLDALSNLVENGLIDWGQMQSA